MTLRVRRGDAVRTLGPATPRKVGDQRLLGFVFDVKRDGTLHFGPLRSAHLAAQELWLVTKGTGEALRNLVVRGDRSNVQGVVGIVREQSTAVGQGLYLEQLAWLSLSLALFNLLPFLPLDGGHILFALIERVRRSRSRASSTSASRWSASRSSCVLFLFVLQQDVGPHPGRRAPGPVTEPRILDGWWQASVRSCVGGIPIGGGAPVSVQSMTTTKTHDVEATLEQIGRLREAGADIVRVAVPGIPDADALPAIVAAAGLPIIADIHFNASLALRAHGHGRRRRAHQPRQHRRAPTRSRRSCARRRRPGRRCASAPTPGSLPEHLRPMATADPAGALVAAAMEEVELLERLDFRDFKISVKSSSVPVDDRGLPAPGRRGAVSAAPGRDRGRAARRRHGQVGRSASARCWPTASATRSASR